MAPRISRVQNARRHRSGTTFSVNAIDLQRLEGLASPLALLDDFRVSGAPFGPHPHAGFSAITYVLEDSPVALRSRDSLGNDLDIRPGGIVWLQAGKGAQHQEVPAIPGRELHGAQIYVNLSARNKVVAPRTMYLQPEEVPVWTDEAANRVRVLVGRYGDLASAIAPAEPYRILDARIATEVRVPLGKGDHTVLYCLDGAVELAVDDAVRALPSQAAIAVADAANLRLAATAHPAHVLVLSGAALDEPVVADGPFIMNDAAGIRAAQQRYHAGGMGHLAPV
ncbi:pirin family protein [Ancylobacter lacus]|uniref:pirin family protein n=1 Tax=Ancylobacter lacus TaxID=2579970 RepID=UPI001BD16D9E|nr:pirin family protein [Ancylobacter lacus]MBS7537680.1 pirin family protein [Ancylobacter lacus]